MLETIIESTEQPTNQTNEPEKIIIKKASKPKAKPTPKTIKKEVEQPNIKVKNELDEEEVIEFIKKNEKGGISFKYSTSISSYSCVSSNGV